ncbi:hypothetical protein [Kurthia massiliensis]|uniref:hypothetical protein n=1 Tax=Kurthia massiliensis TaxID=1033739 RepID=UPI0012B57725|nr:hypothetical protein [Kurthia massiliensis]
MDYLLYEISNVRVTNIISVTLKDIKFVENKYFYESKNEMNFDLNLDGSLIQKDVNIKI